MWIAISNKICHKPTRPTTHAMGGGFQWVGQNITHTHTHRGHGCQPTMGTHTYAIHYMPCASPTRSPLSRPKRTTFSRRSGSPTTDLHALMPAFNWPAARASIQTSSKTTPKGIPKGTYVEGRSSKARVGLLSSRRVMTPALHHTSSSGIMRVSNSLTRGTGSGSIDGGLGMW